MNNASKKALPDGLSDAEKKHLHDRPWKLVCSLLSGVGGRSVAAKHAVHRGRCGGPSREYLGLEAGEEGRSSEERRFPLSTRSQLYK